MPLNIRFMMHRFMDAYLKADWRMMEAQQRIARRYRWRGPVVPY